MYWCTSNAKLLFGSIILDITWLLGVPYFAEVQSRADDQPLPGTKMRLLAPVCLILATASLAASSHTSVRNFVGSFIKPKTTKLLFLYRRASWRHRSPSASVGKLGVPIMAPKYFA